jgi:hypothetical protein
MGGFTGLDPAPTLGDFEHFVVTGRLHYAYIPGGGGGGSTGSSVAAWIEKHGTVVPSAAYGGASGDSLLYRLSGSIAPR